MWRSVIALVAVVAALASGAAADNDATEQLWLDYHRHFYVNPTWEYFGDGGFRTDPGAWQKLYWRPSLRRHGTQQVIEGRGGLGFFYTYNDTTNNQLEIRPWVGAFVKWPRLGPMTITNYFRLEARFQGDTDGTWDEALRFRYKLGTKLPLKHGVQLKYFYVPVSAEWFVDVGPSLDNVFAEDWRFDAGLGHIFGDRMVGEFHFIVQRSRSGLDQTFETNDFIFRFTVKRLWSTRDYMSQDS
jgi:hypothetical protein